MCVLLEQYCNPSVLPDPFSLPYVLSRLQYKRS